MKKTIIALMGLFTLVACSDEAYLDSNGSDSNFGDTSSSSNPGDKRANTFNDSDTGWIDVVNGYAIHPGNGYHSPWDVWFRNAPYTPNYLFLNDEGVAGHSSPFIVRFTPWVGLAYYDGVNDGIYRDPAQGNAIVANFAANPTQYPNLYAGGKEVGNLLRANPIVLNGVGPSYDDIQVQIASDESSTNPEHLLSPGGSPHPGAYNPTGMSFNINGTAQERNLLARYGKIFYYEVDVIVRATGAPAPVGTSGKVFVQVKNDMLDGSSPSPHFVNTGIQATIPGSVATRDVYYYHNTTPGFPNDTQWPGSYPTYSGAPGYSCNSREVVIKQAYPSEVLFGYGTKPWKVSTGMLIGSYLWQTSGPWVAVIPQ